ncbi:MarR family winged helix-turn-helix transcriptional regulator [Novosphingobium sp. FKTRR1]|uniref:MarR family winged helix-turn-helix transcriptional regulator n=1 Tax=unclassified Novosphingobium TaxID=2644732 RepID=UPI001CEFF4FA|nr:MarR family winged helix-turn-helix transcriptional regulator [Novosphingobium sp. FKTRR1]
MDDQTVTPDNDIAAADLLVRLLKVGSFITAPMRDGVCDQVGIAPPELRVAMALAGEGDLAGHDLVEITGLTAMNVSRAIAALRERGWVEDAHDPVNRRRRPVRLSATGRVGLDQTAPHFEVVAQAVLDGLTRRQRETLAKLTDRINSNLVNWIRSHHQDVQLSD